jgi:hypothetical protein
MTNQTSSIRWLRAAIAGLAVIALSFLVVIAITTVYAFGLAFQARGAPDQSAIRQMAAAIGTKWLPWIEIASTFVVAAALARRAQGASVIQGLMIGVFAAVFGLVVPLAFGAHLGLRHAVFVVLATGAGCLGGLLRKTGPEEKAKRAEDGAGNPDSAG